MVYRCGAQPKPGRGNKSLKAGVIWICQSADKHTGIQRCLAAHINNIPKKEKMCAWGIGPSMGEDKKHIGSTSGVGPYAPGGDDFPTYPLCYEGCQYCGALQSAQKKQKKKKKKSKKTGK